MIKKRNPPAGSIRQSQVVTTFGPGAMVDLLKHAVLVGGLEFWNGANDRIEEPRLREAVADRLRALGLNLSREYPFYAPPAGDDADPAFKSGIQVLEFPQWFVCQKCKSLQWKSGLEIKSDRYIHQCKRDKRGECVPVRFVATCERGHLDEIDWVGFVHGASGTPRCHAPELELDEGARGDFNDIEVRCACGARTKLNAMYNYQLSCTGERPWLGRAAKQTCELKSRLLVRTASNSYFPQVMSALSIPPQTRKISERVLSCKEELWAAKKEDLAVLRRLVPKVREALDGLDDDDVLGEIAILKAHETEGTEPPRAPLRTAEFVVLAGSAQEVAGELPDDDDKFFARIAAARGGLPDGVARLVVVPKLREVAALVGFTRVEPVSPDMQGEYDLSVKTAALGHTSDWLPATEMFGEGVFLQLDEHAVQKWEARDVVKERAKELDAGFSAYAAKNEFSIPFPGVRFYLLHSLSHLLISAISLECGYAASSIRERIYCGPSAQDPTQMAGVLLSTGTPGAEGTLGGLVEQGRRIIEHIRHAFDLGRLCSNDPVCGTHSPEDDRAERFLEGAACHGCLYIAESSCERFNQYLDRALVVPTIGHAAELAFFSTRP